MRSVVLYQMNALVEDQLNRLRVLLDSDAARKWRVDWKVPCPITFARYNSLTPVPGYQQKCDKEDTLDPTGEANEAKLDRLNAELAAMRKASFGLDKLIDLVAARHKNAKDDKARDIAREELDPLREARSFIPRYGGSGDIAEQDSLWQIQQSPHDVLVTNFFV